MLASTFFSIWCLFLCVSSAFGGAGCTVPTGYDGNCGGVACPVVSGDYVCDDGELCDAYCPSGYSCVGPSCSENEVECDDGTWLDNQGNNSTNWDGILCSPDKKLLAAGELGPHEHNKRLLGNCGHEQWACLCFHDLATVDVLTEEGVVTRTVADVQNGDKVLSVSQSGDLFFDDVYYIREHGDIRAPMIELKTADSSTSVTAEHLVFSSPQDATVTDYCMDIENQKACAVRAADVKEGDTLWVNKGDGLVPQFVETITHFAGKPRTFFTYEGTAIVNNAAVSCHSRHHEYSQAVMLPVRLTSFLSKDLPNHPVMDAVWKSFDHVRHTLRELVVRYGTAAVVIAVATLSFVIGGGVKKVML